jgi:hypothetical protein
MATLKASATGALIGTAVAPFAGVVRVTVGRGAAAVMNDK